MACSCTSRSPRTIGVEPLPEGVDPAHEASRAASFSTISLSFAREVVLLAGVGVHVVELDLLVVHGTPIFGRSHLDELPAPRADDKLGRLLVACFHEDEGRSGGGDPLQGQKALILRPTRESSHRGLLRESAESSRA